MSDDVVNIVNERLNRMEKFMRKEFGVMKEAIRRIDARMSHVDSYLAGLHSQTRWQQDELDDHRGRLEHLEQSLKDNDQDPLDE
ncbi:MAG: hypothetical protein H6861_09270 [Rhodospirillales bacterium]|nr:hypothetical protein [Rhodospirillales bacterium]